MPWARQRLESAITDDILLWNRVGGISMRRLFLGTAALLAAARLLCAQEYRATITGTITDASGASVPGAQVSAGNLQNGLTVKSESNTQGHYVIPYLLPGRYKVQVEHAGFKTFEQSSVELRVSDRIEVNAVLQVGQVTEKM